jgi:hypothetical protein
LVSALVSSAAANAAAPAPVHPVAPAERLGEADLVCRGTA